MPDRVVDASVVAARCFREPRAAEADILLRDSRLFAPSLLAFELANVARKHALQTPDRLSTLTEALGTVLASDIQWIDVDCEAIVRLAVATGLTAYDANYLYLARTLGLPLVTFDERLAREAAR